MIYCDMLKNLVCLLMEPRRLLNKWSLDRYGVTDFRFDMSTSCLSAFPRHLLYHQLTAWSLWVGLVQLHCVSLAASSKLIICPSFSYCISTLLLWPDLPGVPCSVSRPLPRFAGCLPWCHGLRRSVTVVFPFQFSFMLEQAFYSWTKGWKQTLLHLFLCQALW